MILLCPAYCCEPHLFLHPPLSRFCPESNLTFYAYFSLSLSLARSHSLYRRTKHTKALLKPHSTTRQARQLHLLFFFPARVIVAFATTAFAAWNLQHFCSRAPPFIVKSGVGASERASVYGCPIFAYFWMCHLSIDSFSSIQPGNILSIQWRAFEWLPFI